LIHGAWVVVCRYEKGDEVAWHTDADYQSRGFDKIVSFTPVGKARLSVRADKSAVPCHLALNDRAAFVFTQRLGHMVNQTEERRINITVRYAKKGEKSLFITPEWYDEQNYK
jgi:hypothetical protein